MLLDEIFGESNSVGVLIWRKKEGGGQTDTYFVTEHEYILVYQKSSDFKWLDEVIQIEDTSFKNGDENGKFNLVKLAKWGNAARKEDREKMHFPIKAPDGKKVIPYAPDGNLGRWRVGKKRMEELLENDLVEFIKNKEGEWIAYEKIYHENGSIKVIKERSIIYELTNTADASKQLTEVFGKKDAFPTPKPIDLPKFFLQNSIVLDSFAGSGTTAHAVLELNKEDGGNRKFILVEQEDYANTLTAERVRRVIKRLNHDLSDSDISMIKDKKKREAAIKNQSNQANQKNNSSDTFSYFEIGDSIEMESILTGKSLPSFEELARYIFYTATGQEFHEKKINRKTHFIGETEHYELYMMYEPNIDWLKQNALTLDGVRSMPKYTGKQRLVFAPAKYVDDYTLLEHRIDFCQLPYEIYRIQK
jgi:adenine-specific DNA-methyltransferase